MKSGSRIFREEMGAYSVVTIKSEKVDSIQYRYMTSERYFNRYLNDQNLSYYNAHRDEDEEDKYLLYRALQRDRKLCATFWTKNVDTIMEVFSDKTRYSSVVKDTDHKPYKMVYVARNGKLIDYYNMNDIIHKYSMMNISLRQEILLPMCEEEMINILSGKYTHPWLSVPYNVVMRFDGDKVIQEYGPEGLVVSGLLLGYPLESTADLIKYEEPYF